MEPVERKSRGGTEILTIREVAGYLKLPVSTVYRLAERRDLPGHKVGRQWRFHKSVLDDWFRQHAATSRSTVLVVDDEEAIRELMVTALATKTRDVLAAASGEEALEILKRTEVDLVLLDLVDARHERRRHLPRDPHAPSGPPGHDRDRLSRLRPHGQGARDRTRSR